MGVYKEVLINIDTQKRFKEVVDFIHNHPTIEENTIKPHMLYLIETIQMYLEDDIEDEMLLENWCMNGIPNDEVTKKRKSIMEMKIHHLSEYFDEVIHYLKTGNLFLPKQ